MSQLNSIIDPGRVLLHALVYISKHATFYPTQAWVDAENILHRARNQFEDDDRIQFVRYIEQQELCYSSL
jgi:hypothetical protein